ncbi:MAG: glycosyltransferase [Chloroflexota bacterium]|nr:glycosyltransferase [Chloroflexota bacterium]
MRIGDLQRGIRWISDRLGDGKQPEAGRRPRLLLVCDYRPHEAATVIDHIDAIRRWSRSDVFVLPIFGDLPDGLDLERFDGLILHYNLIMSSGVYLSPLARWRVSQFSGVKAAFVQDEYRFVDSTVGVMRSMGIEVLFTCVPEDQVELVYPQSSLPQMKRKVTVLTGYVPEELLSLPLVPYQHRTVDVAYRGRRLPAWLGSLAQEKTTIAERFLADAPTYGLSTDISTSEGDRLYGDAWISFIASSRSTLGVESGASVFDFDGSVEQAIRGYLASHPDAPFDEVHRLFLSELDGRIRLNQISPRCFEAAALGTLMVLYPGDYSGILKPWQHYVPLEKDHSNMAEVASAIHDRSTWERITAQARDEVALDRRYSFAGMVEIVDDALALPVTSARPMPPREFERVASQSYRRMRTTQLYAFGLSPRINRVRIMAGRALIGLRPNPIAISTSPPGPHKRTQAMRELWRYLRSLAYWALRPHLLPTSQLLRHRGALLRELSELSRLQLMGARALKTGAGSPFVLLVGEPGGDVRLVLRTDAPASGRPLEELPRELRVPAGLTLDLRDEWLVPLGVRGSPARRLEAFSAVLRARPGAGRRLLAGPGGWCAVVAVAPG